VQSVFARQSAPGGQAGQVPPPQSVPVSLPFLTPSEQAGVAQMPSLQKPLVQSVPSRHRLPTAQSGQLPPQSTSLSSPFCT